MKRKKAIFVLLIILLFISIFYCCIFSLCINNFDYFGIKDEIISSRKENKYLFVSLIINDDYCSFDSMTNTCYFYTNKDDKVKLKSRVYLINDNVNYISISGFNLSKMLYDVNENNEILIYDDNNYFILNVKFTTLPIVNINDKKDISGYLENDFTSYLDQRSDKDMLFRLYSDTIHNINTLGTYHARGSASFGFEKKSYKVELMNGYSILGMNSDKDWVLDALYTDKSKIRNKLSSYIWSLINDNQKINNDLSGEYVEVFINDVYNGLYVLKEKVDKETTDVLEDGILLKSIEHIFDYNIDRFSSYDVTIDFYNGSLYLENFEIKHHSDESLTNFITKFGNYYFYNYNYNVIRDTFDLNNYLNYKLFMMLINGTDNVTKNQYLSMSNSNSKILITPWDMDLTWGLYFENNNILLSSFSMESSYDANWIFENIVNNMDGETLNALKNRYWELRKKVITMDTISSYLDSYKELLVNSGAAKRDSERWYNYDIEYEIENIRAWANNRIMFLDEYFKL